MEYCLADIDAHSAHARLSSKLQCMLSSNQGCDTVRCSLTQLVCLVYKSAKGQEYFDTPMLIFCLVGVHLDGRH